MIKFDVKNSVTFKIIFTAFLALVLMIPLGMVENLIRERQNRRNEAINEVSSKWGFLQNINGPFLVIPYRNYVTDGKKVIDVTEENAYFLPETTEVRGTVNPERRARGLYEVILYSLKDLSFSGSFTRPDFGKLGIADKNVLWDLAYLSIGIPDTRGIQRGVKLKWNNREIPFMPGVLNTRILKSGIHASIKGLRNDRSISFDYSFAIDLRGSSGINFTPTAKETSVILHSSWPHPSFHGAYLPEEHKIGDDGFTARWKVSYFGRNFPQEFTGSSMPGQEDLDSTSFGVRLFIPVDFYQKCERAVKYGFLFITLTFLAFFLFELFNGIAIHPLQYGMVGFAMSIFYLLFLALSEHVGFFASYLSASLGVMVMITGYCIKVLRTRKRAGYMFGLLFALYSFLYVLLENEDNALLLGALALFAILAAVMYLTRNVDWYKISFGQGNVTSE